MRAAPPPLGTHFGPDGEMGEKVSEAPEPVPRGCSGHGSRTPASALGAASSPGASSAESSSGSETLSEEGEPGGFSRKQQPPPPPQPPPPSGGALGARPPAAWAPARVLLERGVPALPPPPPGGAVPPAPRGSSASQEEQDEEVGPAFPKLAHFGSRQPGDPSFPSRAQAVVGRALWPEDREGPQALCPEPGATTVKEPRCGLLTSLWLLPPCVCLHVLPMVCF